MGFFKSKPHTVLSTSSDKSKPQIVHGRDINPKTNQKGSKSKGGGKKK